MASANPATTPRIVRGGRARDGEHRARRAERDGDIAGAEADPERGGHVVAACRAPTGCPRQPQLLGGRRRTGRRRHGGRTAGSRSTSAAVAAPTTVEQLGAVRAAAGSNQPVPDASPRSVTCSPRSRQVSQSCGSITRRTASNTSGSRSVQPRQLGDRERGHRHATAALRPPRRAASRLDESAGLRRRDSCRSTACAGRSGAAGARRRPPGRAAGPPTATATTRCRNARLDVARAARSAAHHAAGSCSLTRRLGRRVRAAAVATTAPVSASRSLHLGRLRRRVDPAHQCAHRTVVSRSRPRSSTGAEWVSSPTAT